MKLSTRYALVGMGALAVLSLVHWARRAQYDGGAVVNYLIGVMPNVAAAVAIPFIVLGIWADQNPSASAAAARRVFLVMLLFAGAGLIVWEFVQQSSRTLVFDTHDIAATFAGLGAAYLLFLAVTPNGQLPASSAGDVSSSHD